MMRRAVFNQLELERLDWVSRHDYYDRLYARRQLRTIRELANHMSPDVLLSGTNTGKVIMYRGGAIPLPNKAGHVGGPKKKLKQTKITDYFLKGSRTLRNAHPMSAR